MWTIVRPIEHHHIANQGDQMASALFGELRSKFLLLLLELIELHFYELVMPQDLIKRGEELRAETFLADLERCLELLGLGFEFADLGVAQRVHCTSLREPIPPSHEENHRFPHQTIGLGAKTLVRRDLAEWARSPI